MVMLEVKVVMMVKLVTVEKITMVEVVVGGGDMSMVMDVVKLHETRIMVKTRFHSVVFQFSVVAFRMNAVASHLE